MYHFKSNVSPVYLKQPSVRTLHSVLPQILGLFLLFVQACNHKPSPNSLGNVSSDSTAHIQIKDKWFIPKESFDFNSIGSAQHDTLEIFTCSDFVYSPFGHLKDTSNLDGSLLKDFTITAFKLDTFTNLNDPEDRKDDLLQWYQTLDIEQGNNKLNLFFDNDPEASRHSYLRGGKLIESNVALLYNIKVGMKEADFFNQFFESYTPDLVDKVDIVEFVSCVTDIRHIYTFRGKVLISIQFISE